MLGDHDVGRALPYVENVPGALGWKVSRRCDCCLHRPLTAANVKEGSLVVWNAAKNVGAALEPHLCNAASTFPAEKHKRYGDQIDNGGRKERKRLNCELMPNYKFPLIVTRR